MNKFVFNKIGVMLPHTYLSNDIKLNMLHKIFDLCKVLLLNLNVGVLCVLRMF